MSTLLRATLEEQIEKWMERHCEEAGWGDWWYDTNLNVRMAEAAFAVFVAAREAQDFLIARQDEEKSGG